MEKIVIGFSTHKKFNLLSSLIRWGGKTPYSHIYVLYRSGVLGRAIICHAARSFLHFVELNNFAKDNETVHSFSVSMNSDLYIKVIQKSIDNAGKKYGVGTLLGIGLVTLMKWFGIKTNNPFADGADTFICSEWASTVVDMLGLKEDKVDPEDTGLKWLYKMLLKESERRGSGVEKIK